MRIDTGREIAVVPPEGERRPVPVWRVSAVVEMHPARAPRGDERRGKGDAMRGRLIDIIV